MNAGASFGNVKTDFNAPFSIKNPLGGTETFSGFAGSDRTYPSGFMGGGQIGYNWQYSPLIVVGLEADIQGALERDSNTLSFTPSQIIGSTGGFATALLNYTAKIDWFGTVRTRIGYVWGNGDVMSYVTGGLAYGKVDLEGNASGVIDGILPFSGLGISHSQVNTGWVVGYGTEGVIDFWGARNWTWKIESLYIDLGHIDATGVGSLSFGPCPACGKGATPFTGTGQITAHSHFTDGILRAGLSYQFH